MTRRPGQFGYPRGFSLTIAIVCVSVLALIAAAIASIAAREQSFLNDDFQRLQAAWLAEAGIERAAARLALDRGYPGEDWSIEPAALDGHHGATVTIAVEPGTRTEERRVRVRAVYPATSPRPKQTTKILTINLDQLQSSKEMP